MKLIDLLMTLQYDFPIDKSPFSKIACRYGIDVDNLISLIRRLRDSGVIRRIGSVLNYRSRDLKAALVALKVPEPYVEDVSKYINELGGVSHNFLREHEYNIWFVIKRKNIEDIVKIVKEICYKYSINKYVVLESTKTYRLDVRFDLYRGISRAKILIQNENPPKLESVSRLPIELLRELCNIEISERPFVKLCEKYNIDEEYLIEEIKRLISLNVLRDFYAVLNQERIGFKINAMIILDVDLVDEHVKNILNLEEPTHVVYRRFIYGSDKMFEGLYLMIHAVCRDVVQDFIRRNLQKYKFQIIYSCRNLLPSMPHDIEYT